MCQHGSFGVTSSTRGVAEDVDVIRLGGLHVNVWVPLSCFNNIIEVIHFETYLFGGGSFFFWNFVKANNILKIFLAILLQLNNEIE